MFYFDANGGDYKTTKKKKLMKFRVKYDMRIAWLLCTNIYIYGNMRVIIERHVSVYGEIYTNTHSHTRVHTKYHLSTDQPTKKKTERNGYVRESNDDVTSTKAYFELFAIRRWSEFVCWMFVPKSYAHHRTTRFTHKRTHTQPTKPKRFEVTFLCYSLCVCVCVVLCVTIVAIRFSFGTQAPISSIHSSRYFSCDCSWVDSLWLRQPNRQTIPKIRA